MAKNTKSQYGLPEKSGGPKMAAPKLNYRPPKPKKYRPRIGLIGCGGVTQHHLTAYQKDRYKIAAMCDIDEKTARERRDQYGLKSDIYTDYRELLARDDIEVVDIATHPEVRGPIIKDALEAGKHVLSQKPFVLDLAYGKRLVELAQKKGLKLAVNQNGRWAPYFSYMREAVKAGIIGDVQTFDSVMQWNHLWIQGTAFEALHHLILYDFAIHWFDAVASVFHGRKSTRVYARTIKAAGQQVKPPMLAHAVVEFEGGLATLAFNGHNSYGKGRETNIITGSRGTLYSQDDVCQSDTVHLDLDSGSAVANLSGKWFPEGMRGTMGELLCAIEEDREPLNSARENLRSLEIGFAAMRSADTGRAVVPGQARRVT